MCKKKQNLKKRWFNLGLTRCSYCCIQLNWKEGFKNSATIERIIVKSRGGSLAANNTLIVCSKCNLKRCSKGFVGFVTGSRLPRLNWLLTKYTIAVKHKITKGKH